MVDVVREMRVAPADEGDRAGVTLQIGGILPDGGDPPSAGNRRAAWHN